MIPRTGGSPSRGDVTAGRSPDPGPPVGSVTTPNLRTAPPGTCPDPREAHRENRSTSICSSRGHPQLSRPLNPPQSGRPDTPPSRPRSIPGSSPALPSPAEDLHPTLGPPRDHLRTTSRPPQTTNESALFHDSGLGRPFGGHRVRFPDPVHGLRVHPEAHRPGSNLFDVAAGGGERPRPVLHGALARLQIRQSGRGCHPSLDSPAPLLPPDRPLSSLLPAPAKSLHPSRHPSPRTPLPNASASTSSCTADARPNPRKSSTPETRSVHSPPTSTAQLPEFQP